MKRFLKSLLCCTLILLSFKCFTNDVYASTDGTYVNVSKPDGYYTVTYELDEHLKFNTIKINNEWATEDNQVTDGIGNFSTHTFTGDRTMTVSVPKKIHYLEGTQQDCTPFFGGKYTPDNTYPNAALLDAAMRGEALTYTSHNDDYIIADDGYEFLGWFDDTGKIYKYSDSVNSDITLHGKYIQKDNNTTDFGWSIALPRGVAKRYVAEKSDGITYNTPTTDAYTKYKKSGDNYIIVVNSYDRVKSQNWESISTGWNNWGTDTNMDSFASIRQDLYDVIYGTATTHTTASNYTLGSYVTNFSEGNFIGGSDVKWTATGAVSLTNQTTANIADMNSPALDKDNDAPITTLTPMVETSKVTFKYDDGHTADKTVNLNSTNKIDTDSWPGNPSWYEGNNDYIFIGWWTDDTRYIKSDSFTEGQVLTAKWVEDKGDVIGHDGVPDSMQVKFNFTVDPTDKGCLLAKKDSDADAGTYTYNSTDATKAKYDVYVNREYNSNPLKAEVITDLTNSLDSVTVRTNNNNLIAAILAGNANAKLNDTIVPEPKGINNTDPKKTYDFVNWTFKDGTDIESDSLAGTYNAEKEFVAHFKTPCKITYIFDSADNVKFNTDYFKDGENFKNNATFKNEDKTMELSVKYGTLLKDANMVRVDSAFNYNMNSDGIIAEKVKADADEDGLEFFGWFLEDGTMYTADKELTENITLHGKFIYKDYTTGDIRGASQKYQFKTDTDTNTSFKKNEALTTLHGAKAVQDTLDKNWTITANLMDAYYIDNSEGGTPNTWNGYAVLNWKDLDKDSNLYSTLVKPLYDIVYKGESDYKLNSFLKAIPTYIQNTGYKFDSWEKTLQPADGKATTTTINETEILNVDEPSVSGLTGDSDTVIFTVKSAIICPYILDISTGKITTTGNADITPDSFANVTDGKYTVDLGTDKLICKENSDSHTHKFIIVQSTPEIKVKDLTVTDTTDPWDVEVGKADGTVTLNSLNVNTGGTLTFKESIKFKGDSSLVIGEKVSEVIVDAGKRVIATAESADPIKINITDTDKKPHLLDLEMYTAEEENLILYINNEPVTLLANERRIAILDSTDKDKASYLSDEGNTVKNNKDDVEGVKAYVRGIAENIDDDNADINYSWQNVYGSSFNLDGIGAFGEEKDLKKIGKYNELRLPQSGKQLSVAISTKVVFKIQTNGTTDRTDDTFLSGEGGIINTSMSYEDMLKTDEKTFLFGQKKDVSINVDYIGLNAEEGNGYKLVPLDQISQDENSIKDVPGIAIGIIASDKKGVGDPTEEHNVVADASAYEAAANVYALEEPADLNVLDVEAADLNALNKEAANLNALDEEATDAYEEPAESKRYNINVYENDTNSDTNTNPNTNLMKARMRLFAMPVQRKVWFELGPGAEEYIYVRPWYSKEDIDNKLWSELSDEEKQGLENYYENSNIKEVTGSHRLSLLFEIAE